jgi:pantothenate kinase
MADPICTFLFSVIVMVTTFTVVRDILIVLMEGMYMIYKSMDNSNMTSFFRFANKQVIY